jgi:hypothetical protein
MIDRAPSIRSGMAAHRMPLDNRICCSRPSAFAKRGSCALLLIRPDPKAYRAVFCGV